MAQSSLNGLEGPSSFSLKDSAPCSQKALGSGPAAYGKYDVSPAFCPAFSYSLGAFAGVTPSLAQLPLS